MHNLPLTSFYIVLLQFVTYDWNILTWIMPVYVTYVTLKLKYLSGSNYVLNIE